MTQRSVFRKLFNGLSELISIAKNAADGHYKESAKLLLELFTSCINNRNMDELFEYARDLYLAQSDVVREISQNVPTYSDDVDNDNGIISYNYIDKHDCRFK